MICAQSECGAVASIGGKGYGVRSRRRSSARTALALTRQGLQPTLRRWHRQAICLARSGRSPIRRAAHAGIACLENEMRSDPDDRFGIPDALIVEMIRAHRGVIRDGCYVPTRAEVAGASAEKLWGWLVGWFWESPAEDG